MQRKGKKQQQKILCNFVGSNIFPVAEKICYLRVSDEGDRGAGEGVGGAGWWGGGVKHSASTVIGSPPIANRNLTFSARRSGEERRLKESRSAGGIALRSEHSGVSGVGWREVKRPADKSGRKRCQIRNVEIGN